MNASFFKTLAEQAYEMEPWPDPRFPPSVYYRFFRLLVANIHPSLSVELGTCGVGAAFHMAIGWPDGMVIGIDHGNQNEENIAFVEQHCARFQFMWGDSVKLAPDVGAMGLISLLFIDTTHEFRQTLDEFYAYEPYLAHNAIICLDDLFRPGMEEAWYELPGHKVRLDKLHIGGSPTDGGFGVIWLE